MKILYLHPSKSLSKAEYCFIPVGVVALLNLLKEMDFEIEGLNVGLELSLDRAFCVEKFLQEVLFDIVLIDLHWYEHAFAAVHLAKICKSINHDCKTILGGLTASLFAAEIVREYPWVDFVVTGDAELPLMTLCRKLADGQRNLEDVPNLVFRTSDSGRQTSGRFVQTDLDALNFVDIDFLRHAPFYLRTSIDGFNVAQDFNTYWLCIGRGCSYQCSFCGGGSQVHQAVFGRRGILARSSDQVARDIVCLSQRGVHQVSLTHDLCTLGPLYWSRLFEELRRLPSPIGLYHECWQLPDPAFLDAFQQTVDLRHSSLTVSPVSGCEKVRSAAGKQFSNQQLLSFIDAAVQRGVPVDLYFSSNLPGETEITFRETLALAEQIVRMAQRGTIRLYCQPHTLDPCSPLAQAPDSFGVSVYFQTFQDYVNYCRTPSRWQNLGIRSASEVDVPLRQAQWRRSIAQAALQCLVESKTKL